MLGALSALVPTGRGAEAQIIRQNLFVTDGAVYAMAVSGEVRTVVPDGSGGRYIGGDFTAVYFARLTAGSAVEVRKVVVAR